MCNDNEEAEGFDEVVRVMAMLHGPEVERGMDEFIEHMKQVIPDFAQDIDHNLLLVMFSAGRTQGIKYMGQYIERMHEAANGITAIVLSDYSEARGLDVDAMNANLDSARERAKKEVTQ